MRTPRRRSAEHVFGRGRLQWIEACLALSMLIVVARLIDLQVFEHEDWKREASDLTDGTIQMLGPRADILDRNGDVLASSVKRSSVFVNPSEIDYEEVAVLLSGPLERDQENLLKELRQPDRKKKFKWIQRLITPRQKKLIQDLALPGVGLRTEFLRYYPEGQLASNVVGFVGKECQGLEGIEKKFETSLGYQAKIQRYSKDGTGRMLGSVVRQLFQPPETLTVRLTLDINAQYIVEKELERALQECGANSATAVVLDAKSAQVLAMACLPHYDPGHYQEFPPEALRNRAVKDVYCPGSTFKPFAAAVALDAGLVQESTQFFCENGSWKYSSATLHDVSPHGTLSVRQILVESSNIGIAKISALVPPEDLYKGLCRFGFGVPTGIKLPSEEPGVLHSPDRWTGISFAQTAIGQEVNCSPLQLATAYAALANEGRLMRPYIVLNLKDQSGNVVKEWAPEDLGQAVSKQTAGLVTDILSQVVSDGTGARAAIPGYRVAGKTGTSQKVDENTHAYSHTLVTCLFAGFFPVPDPQIVIVVVVDEPKTGRMGGIVAAPVFSRIGQELAILYEIEPTEGDQNPDGGGAPGPSPQATPNPFVVAVGKQTSSDLASRRMPDYRGYTLMQAMKEIQESRLQVQVQVKGSGKVVHQIPAPGTPIQDYTVCWLDLAR